MSERLWEDVVGMQMEHNLDGGMGGSAIPNAQERGSGRPTLVECISSQNEVWPFVLLHPAQPAVASDGGRST